MSIPLPNLAAAMTRARARAATAASAPRAVGAYRLAIGVAALLAGTRASHAAPSPTPSISSVVDLGNHGGERWLRLVGSFLPAVTPCTGAGGKYPDIGCYRASVFCNGSALLPGRIVTKANTWIDVAIPERPSLSRCAVSVSVRDSGERTGPTQAAIDQVGLAPPPIEIHGVNDRGSVGALHAFELYGYFPVGGDFAAGVVCDGRGIAAQVTTPNRPSTVANQINIAFVDPTTSSESCVFTIRRRNDDVGTPPWHQRLHGGKLGAAALPALWGAYYWGGFEPEWLGRADTPQLAVRRLREAGLAGPIRFSLNPGQRNAGFTAFSDYYDDYNQAGFRVERAPGERCAGVDGVPGAFLPTAVCTTRMLNAFAETAPGSTIVLTTIDEASGGPFGDAGGYLNLSVMSGATYDAVKREYQQLAAALLRTQAGTGKTFVIANWETDSMLYSACGGPAAVADAVRSCTSAPDAACIPAQCRGYPDKIRALRRWFTARKEGIDLARAQAGNPSGVAVADGVEFAQYRLVNDEGRAQGCSVGPDGLGAEGCLRNADALHGIIPYVHPTYALYSAWESAGLGRVDQDLRELAQYLYATSPAHPPRFGLGEFGRPGQASPGSPFDQWLFLEHAKAARRAADRTRAPGSSPLEFAVIWQAFPTVDEEEALLSVEGAETAAMRSLASASVDYGAGSPGATAAILGVRELPDQGTSTCAPTGFRRTEPHRTFELYGAFPAGAVVWTRCASDAPNATPTRATIVGSPSSLQINVRIPEVAGHPDLWCVFQVTGAGQTSPEFGPILSPGAGPCNPAAP